MKTYKFKLKPTSKQVCRMGSWIHTCRAIYNTALEERVTSYEKSKKSPSKYDQYNQLPQLKKEFPWVADVHSDVLQEVLDRLEKSYKNFFRGEGHPKFSRKGVYKSFTFKRSVRQEGNKLLLPKIGKIKYFNSRQIEGNIKTATIVKEDNGWFICVVAEYETIHETIKIDNQNPIGIDCGVSRYLALSDNTFIDSPLFSQPHERALKLLSRKLSRQKKGSNSREKTKCKIRSINRKIRDTRTDFLHKATTNLSNKYSSVYMEDLDLQKMAGNKLKTVNKGMSDRSFGAFKVILSYKMKERGKYLGLVNPAYTSQTCSGCKKRDKKSRLSQSEFVCTNCGLVENADLNASKNILREGISKSTERKTLV